MIVEQPQQEEIRPKAAPKPGWGTAAAVLVMLVLLVAGGSALVYYGIHSRVVSANTLATETRENAVMAVSVVHPKLGGTEEEVVLPGNTQAFTDSPIYARTTGYLKKWYVDIGTRVKAGQLLAEIDAPELDHQLQQAKADLATAQANLKLAQTTADRWTFLLKTESVSRQETDEKMGDLDAKKAIVDASQNAVHRLEDLQSYEKVTAPFDGVITARNTDVGALIDAGANSAGRELFHLSAIDKVRIFTAVPEIYTRSVHEGAAATVTLDEFPGTSFHGTVVRSTDAIDPVSRALTVEVDVDNPEGRLLPGAYAFVHLTLPDSARSASVTVPAETVIFRKEGLRVAVVRNGLAQLVPIEVGRDYGTKLEVVSGLEPSDEVILDPSDSLTNGAEVHAQLPDPVGTAH